MSAYPWNVYLILMAAGTVGVLAMIPYVKALVRSPLMREKGVQEIPAILIFLQQWVVMIVTGGLGLLVAGQVGLHLSLIEALAAGQPAGAILAEILPLALLVGTIGGALVLLVDLTIFMPRLPKSFHEMNASISMRRRLLIPLTGGIVEEIILRLFAFSLIAWLIGFIWSSPGGAPAAGAFWLAAVLAALLFAVGHLPATAAFTPLTPLVVTRALLLNGVMGVTFAILFWRYGLEAAMIAHAMADVMLHIVGGLITLKKGGGEPVTFIQNEG
jgi:hypothetical protein